LPFLYHSHLANWTCNISLTQT